MPMDHKAFAFDWSQFELELYARLVAALITNEPSELDLFIAEHHEMIKDPYDGAPLTANWRHELVNLDVHEYGDYALTLFYNPVACSGLGYAWARMSEVLPEAAANTLLGFPIGPAKNLFDPGRYGSYFQTPAHVRASLSVLQPYACPELADFLNLLELCSAGRFGLYVTF